VDPAPRSRLTVALAIAAIVVVLVLLLVGALLAPTSEPGTGAEASLAPAATSPVAGGATTSTTVVDHGTHSGSDVVAAIGSATVAHESHEDHGDVAAPATHAEHVEHEDHSRHVVDVGVPIAEAHHHHDTVTTTSAPPSTSTTTTTTVVTGPPAPVDDPDTLVASTFASLTRYPDAASMVAAGYTSEGGGSTGYERFVNRDYVADGVELDPLRVESIVLHGGEIVAGAYDVAGETLTVWLVRLPDSCGQWATMDAVLAGC
jgi:hypothetical protein